MNVDGNLSTTDEVNKKRVGFFWRGSLLVIFLSLFFSCTKKDNRFSKEKNLLMTSNFQNFKIDSETSLELAKQSDILVPVGYDLLYAHSRNLGGASSNTEGALRQVASSAKEVLASAGRLRQSSLSYDGRAGQDGETNSNTTMVFCYEGKLSFKQVIDFYLTNMELLGWDINDLSSENEGMLFCSKINKTCCVSIRKEIITKNRRKEEQVRVYLFLKKIGEGEKNEARDINAKSIILDNFAQTTGFIC